MQCGTEHGTEQAAGYPTSMHGAKGIDPIKMAMIMWHKAFFKAYMEFMTEKLKERMEATMGPTADKVADAIFEAMSKQWQVKMQQAEAETELREKLARIFSEGQKKK
jgi:hypothetical protein